MQMKFNKSSGNAGFTLPEMLVCFAIVGLTMGGILTAYTNSALFTTRAGYSLAAQAQAIQVLERVRAATWDTQSVPVVDNTVNFPAQTVSVLELPISGTNVIYATNHLSVTTVIVSANPLTTVKMIQVDTTWPWNGQVSSNSIVAYRSPDQ
jgi:prepilin-type N-terminal cleavage/methylation domain-containing protein